MRMRSTNIGSSLHRKNYHIHVIDEFVRSLHSICSLRYSNKIRIDDGADEVMKKQTGK